MSVSKIVAAAASSAGGAGLDVDEVFSTFLYEGNGGTQSIVNNIDLTEGGLVWIKNRDDAENHGLVDTAVNGLLFSNLTNAANTGITHTFNTNGFTVGSSGSMNDSNDSHVSWTFRKAKKFFDVVTYTGNDDYTGRAISHNLGSAPGMIWIKKTSGSSNWIVYHRSEGATKYLELDNTSQSNTYNMFHNTEPTSTQFYVSGYNKVNQSGESFVAYLFAHNNNDGGFGPDQDGDIIKCGSYTGNGSATGPVIDLGFEPQWVLIKLASGDGENWILVDNMRGLPVGGNDSLFEANESAAESTTSEILDLTPTGFNIKSTSNGINTNNQTYIYMAIRRGPLAAPTDATKVFALANGAGTSLPLWTSNFPVDMAIQRNVSSATNWKLATRLTGQKELKPNLTDAESTSTSSTFDYMDGWFDSQSNVSSYYSWMWKRAPSYFDVVAYTGTGSARTVPHSLSVPPEMMWVKSRTSGGADWNVYTSTTGNGHFLKLNETDASTATSSSHSQWNFTTPTSSVFSLGASSQTNYSGHNYIAYLFATVAGVSKVGSFSHTNGGGDTNVDCGFSSNARLVIYKRTDSTGSWYIFDSVRGIVAGSGDAQLELNNTGAENTGFDLIDPYSSGFKIPSNAIGTGDYIFYAIA